MEKETFLYEGGKIKITHMLPEVATVYVGKQSGDDLTLDANTLLVLDFGKKKVGDLIETVFLVESETDKVVSTSSSCGCTKPTVSNNQDGTQTIHVKFDSSKITNNVSKVFTFYFDAAGTKFAKFNLIINR